MHGSAAVLLQVLNHQMEPSSSPLVVVKHFSAVSSNLWNVEFEVAGARVAASVNGFGAVFSDVDDPTSTSIEYFAGNRSLGIYFVTPFHMSPGRIQSTSKQIPELI